MHTREVGFLSRFSGLVTFAIGIAIGVAALLWKDAMSRDMPRYLLGMPLVLGALARMLLWIGTGLAQGKTLVEAAGADESKRTSRFVVVLAMVLFVPVWVGALAMTIAGLRASASATRLLVWSLVAAVLSGLIAALIRELRKARSPAPGTPLS
jgi:hypothetical protein